MPLLSPLGRLCSLTRNRPTAQPPCCLVPSQRPLACDLRCAPVASLLRLPTLGYTVDFPLNHGAIALVFAPAHVALRAAFGRLPSQRPLACVRSRSARPSGQPSVAPSRACPGARLSYPWDMRYRAGDLRCAPVASFAPAHVALRAAFGRLPSQRPLACVQVSGFRSQVSGFRFQVFLPPQENRG